MDSTQKMRREIHKLGWKTRLTKNNHVWCTHPDAAYPVTTGATPSDRKAPEGASCHDKKIAWRQAYRRLNFNRRSVSNGAAHFL